MRLLHAVLPAALAGAIAFAPFTGAHAAYKNKDKKGGKPPDAAAAAAGGDKDKPFQDWAKVTKDAEVKSGLFTVYKKRENIYLELKPNQLDMPVLGIFSLARGIGSDFVLGGLPLNDRLITFHRAGDHILVMEQNVRFTAPDGSPISKALDLSMGNSVLASLKIESVQDGTGAILVDFAPFLVSDVTDLAEGLKGAIDKPTRFDKERSALTTVKNFPENLEVEALLTYSPNDRTNLNLDGVPDERFIPITVHYSFSTLPAVPMTPRLADDRVGNFITVKKDFSHDDRESFWVRYAERWRLEKKDPSAAMSEPVKPIVFYLDRTIPKEYRPFVKEGVEKWQRAFEAAGFKNAIIAKEAPDDSTWDAEDVRYSTIRWITRRRPRSARSDRRASIRARVRSSTPTSCSKPRSSRASATATGASPAPRRSRPRSCRRRGCRSGRTGSRSTSAARRRWAPPTARRSCTWRCSWTARSIPAARCRWNTCARRSCGR
jgi:hypothetical protein